VEAFSLEADVPGGVHAAWRARRLIERALDGRLPSDVIGDLELLVTELVANGVRHGGAADGVPLHVRVSTRPASVRVEVENPDADHERVAQRRPDFEGGGGLGLHIVERVASRWGVREDPRTSVWFELDCDALH
jgi:anti-sigma regulatory factor (Ser/Thr protein kinase)